MAQLLVVGSFYDVVVVDGERSFKLTNAKLLEIDDNFISFSYEDGTRNMVLGLRSVGRIVPVNRRGF